LAQNGSPTANWPIRGRWAVASTSTKLRALTTTWSQPPQRRQRADRSSDDRTAAS
jgi:hypothetical protein